MSTIRNSYAVNDTISANTYNFVIGLVLLYGFVVNWFIVQSVPVETLKAINIWVFLIGYFVSCFIGIFLYNGSKSPLVSFIGYNFIVVPFGLVINLVVSGYDPEIVSNAIQTTALVTIAMLALGTMYPAFFKSIASGLFIALLAAIVVELIMIFAFGKSLAFMDWIVALIFCGIIGYDWAEANSAEKTLDNAVDGAANLYMSIINLFLRILSIMGDSK